MKSKEEFFKELATLINELFSVPLDDIKPESRFYEDLNLDSIDAIDLIGQFQIILGKRINPQEFKDVRTVGDVIAVAEQMVHA